LIAIKLCIVFLRILTTAESGSRKDRLMANPSPRSIHGPAILAPDPWAPGTSAQGRVHQLLSDEERARLAVVASIVRFKKGAEIYREGEPADAVFNIISGVAKAYTRGPGKDELIGAFLFHHDLFGLAQGGSYASSMRAVTPITAYRIPIAALRTQFSMDAALEFHVIAKLCHELRQAQRHAFVLASKHTVSKLFLFLQMLEQLQADRNEPTNEIYLPMDRSDISEYVGASLSAISRAFRTLAARGMLNVRNRRHVKIIDRCAFETISRDVRQKTHT
jgi:CRP/FNR family transcriptional regulator